MKNTIIEILKSESFNTTDEAGNKYIVVEESDFDIVAERILEMRKQLLCDFFVFFRENGEEYIGLTIEQFVDEFINKNK